MTRQLIFTAATLTLGVLACSCGSKTLTSASSRASASPALPSPAAAASARCGDGASARVAASPVGRSYHDGDTLSITVDFTAPGCKEIAASFGGFHAPGSPWYKHQCFPSCGGRVSSVFQSSAVPLQAASGETTLVAKTGTFPPPDFSSPPDLEGFTLCVVHVLLDDGVFGGRSYQQDIGTSC